MKKKNQVIIYPNVFLGKNCHLDQGVILGYPPWKKKAGELSLIIGDNAFIRSGTVIMAGVKIGHDFQCGHNVIIREDNQLGNQVMIHNNSQIYPHNQIGNRVVIQAGCFLEAVSLSDGVILGPQVVFTDDIHPRCPRFLECLKGAKVGKRAKIGANCTILPGVSIGEKSLIGAGSVVTKDIPARVLAVGNPAKAIKKISQLTCLKGFYRKVYEWEEK
jgi:acetyltransferase-like isoleucine patch superfamily enzyme